MEDKNSDLKLEESDTIELEKVILQREWSFWENYESKIKDKKHYSDSFKEIYTFNNIIAFWQFWNKYPGNKASEIFFNGEYLKYFFKEKYRITAMNIFEKGIKPEWEDEKNKKGQILTLEYIVDKNLENFLSQIDGLWIKLIFLLIGENLPHSNNINGVRFVDKTRVTKSVIFKFELWVNKNMKDEELEEIKQLLNTEFGCLGTIKPI
jgi:hypothetical protein